MQVWKVIVVLALALAIPATALTACFVHGALALPIRLGTCTAVHPASSPTTAPVATGLVPPFIAEPWPPLTPVQARMGPSLILEPADPQRLGGHLRL